MCADATYAHTLRSTATEKNLLTKEIAGYVVFFREEGAGGEADRGIVCTFVCMRMCWFFLSNFFSSEP